MSKKTHYVVVRGYDHEGSENVALIPDFDSAVKFVERYIVEHLNLNRRRSWTRESSNKWRVGYEFINIEEMPECNDFDAWKKLWNSIPTQ